jgi:hypothetical protein
VELYGLNLKIIELLFTVSKFYKKKIKIINIYIYKQIEF